MGRTKERAWRNTDAHTLKKKLLIGKEPAWKPAWKDTVAPNNKLKQAQKLFNGGVDVDLSDFDSVETVPSMSDSLSNDGVEVDLSDSEQEQCELVENASSISNSVRRKVQNQIPVVILDVINLESEEEETKNNSPGVNKTNSTSTSKGKRNKDIQKRPAVDFQTPVRRKIHDEHAIKKLNAVPTQPFVPLTSKRLETLIPPSNLCHAFVGLSNAQNAAVKDMGFESIKYMNIHTIPSALGHWLLTNYDHRNNTLNIGAHRIEITPTIVRDVLGVPMGANSVKEASKAMSYESVYSEWKRQFGSYSSRISLRQVIERMKLQEDCGWTFKLNFLVVFNTVMGEATKDTTINTRFLTSINEKTGIANMDWCSYIITCLKRTKEEWAGKGTYNGPLTFLAVLYAHDQLLRHAPAKARTPAIQYVTNDSLLELESKLFGKNCVEAGINEKIRAGMEQSQQSEQLFYDDADVEIKQEHELDDDPSPVLDSVEKDSSHQRGIICVQGYKMKQSSAPILETIFKKHGDIAAECVFKTNSVRSSFLEVVCDVVRRIQADDGTVDNLEDVECQVSEAEAANIDVSWLQAHLKAIRESKEAGNKYSLLMETRTKTVLVKRAANIDLRERSEELMAAQKRFINTERCVRVLHLVEKNLTENILEAKAKMVSCVNHSVL